MSIARITPIVGSLYALMRQALGLNVETPLGAQELSCTISPDRRLVVLGTTPISGFERDLGTVADEAAMLALHTLDSATLLVSPTFVAPGDSVLRADDPGWRWHCIAGHGTALADWERRPLGGALAGLSVSGHTHAISEVTGLQTALDGKQTVSTNLTTLAGVTSSAAGRALLQVATPATAQLPRVNADGTITMIDVPSGGTSTFAGARVVLTSSQSIANGARQKIAWASADYDSSGYWSSGAPTRLTIPSGLGGIYVVGAAIIWSYAAGDLRLMQIQKNNATPYLATDGRYLSGNYVGQPMTVQVALAAGDFVELAVFQNSGSALDIIHDASEGSINTFWLHRVG